MTVAPPAEIVAALVVAPLLNGAVVMDVKELPGPSLPPPHAAKNRINDDAQIHFFQLFRNIQILHNIHK
jgi:hypothetical protein